MNVSPLRIGILGLGDLFERSLLPRLVTEGGRRRFEVCGLCDVDVEAVRRCAGQLGLKVKGGGSFAEMLGDGRIEAIWLLTPAQLHCEQAVAALHAGKNVYVQKPLGTTLAEVDRIIAAEAASRRSVAVAPGQMLSPVLGEVARAIAGGEIGRTYFATAPFMGWGGLVMDWPSDPSWRFREGNGPLRDHGVYGLTTLLWMFGPARRVSAMTSIRTDHRIWRGEKFAVTEHDSAAVLIEFESGAMATVNEGWCPGSATSAALRVHGMAGSIETSGGQWDVDPPMAIVRNEWGGEARRIVKDELVDETADEWAGPNGHVWRDVVHLGESIRSGKQPLNSAVTARAVYALLEAIFESARTGRFVEPA